MDDKVVWYLIVWMVRFLITPGSVLWMIYLFITDRNDRVCFFFADKANRAKQSTQCARPNKFLFREFPNKVNKRANKPNKLKGLFAVVQMSHMIKTSHRKCSDRCPQKQSNCISFHRSLLGVLVLLTIKKRTHSQVAQRDYFPALLSGTRGDPHEGGEPLHVPVGCLRVWNRTVWADDGSAAILPYQQ